MQRICPKCSMPNPADGSFCRSCASPIALVEPTYVQQPQWQEPQQQWNAPDNQWQQPQNQWQEPSAGWQQTPFGGPLAAQNPAVFQPAPSNRPIIALCLVLAGFLCCGPFLSIPGVIVAWVEMNAIKAGRSPESGMQMSQIAFWVGIAVTILSIVGLVISVAFGVLDAVINGI